MEVGTCLLHVAERRHLENHSVCGVLGHFNPAQIRGNRPRFPGAEFLKHPPADIRAVVAGGAALVHELVMAGHLVLCDGRSEEHTSELQSLAYLVCRLLLEKKKI